MKLFARAEIQESAIVADVLDQLSMRVMDQHLLERDVTVTAHNGLPLRWHNGMPLFSEQAPARNVQLAVKRAFDVIVAVVALLLLMPLLLIVSLCIKATSRGPVLFKQRREGLHGEIFDAFKFRSMHVEVCDPSGVTQTMRNDPRVTPIGKFIRKTSIDELPQLLNVVRGEMSLVGPRPHVVGMWAGGTLYKALVPYYDDRLAMRPGITGWAQANGFRGPTVDAGSAIGRVEHDVAYVENFSMWLDLKIIGKTVISEFVTGSGH